ncbi:glycosyltransferase [Neobacillus sp. PS3-40]|uniref:glycosyltransferase family 2 protein n=1 Tax=Neobacillus sp. PS3-40 TaxID=3070679 RepID=UPI0027E1E939|nr:glycosyltransferase [Neobacillus sp. PS3-40]WML44890.1 glycosyltransferase [Neobacillus sp. PS3-40]
MQTNPEFPSFEQITKKQLYIPVVWKFWIGQTAAILWVVFSIWLSLPWVNDLSQYVGKTISILIVMGLAYIPGYLNAFLVVGLLLDRQPPVKYMNCKETISILIAARNEAIRISDTLQNIRKQDYQGQIQVIVIDNGSIDGTSTVVDEEAKKGKISVVCLNEPRAGKHFALNTGLEHVKSDLVITLDADTLLHPSAVRYIVERIQSSPMDVCAVAGSVLVKNSRETFWTRIQEWDYFLGIASVKRLQGLYQGTLVAQGAFSIYKTSVVREMKGWPDAIGEDIVLTWKFLRNNWRVYFEPLAIAFTDVPTKLTHLARQRNRWARGMVEGLKQVKPWEQPRIFTKYLTSINLIMPYLDIVYTFFWLPGLILAFFGFYPIVGPTTLLVLPLTICSNLLLYNYQSHVFKRLHLRVRKNRVGFISFVIVNQMIMSPVSVWGYFQEIFRLKRVWK